MHLITYSPAPLDETSRYPPFIVLAKHVINQLDHNPDSNICFCRNDPVLFGGSRAERKPDVAGVRTALPESGCVGEIICQQSYGRQTRWWTELLLFFEFKLIYKQLLEGLVRNVATRDRSLSTSYHCVF
jgi:hypothetical protein